MLGHVKIKSHRPPPAKGHLRPLVASNFDRQSKMDRFYLSLCRAFLGHFRASKPILPLLPILMNSDPYSNEEYSIHPSILPFIHSFLASILASIHSCILTFLHSSTHSSGSFHHIFQFNTYLSLTPTSH
jgi:hypothetical protein